MITNTEISREIQFLKRRIRYLEQLDKLNTVWQEIHADEFYELQSEFKDVADPQDIFNRYRDLYADDLR